MLEIQLGKLTEHYIQCKKAEAKPDNTPTWYEQMLSVFSKYLELSGISPILANFTLKNVRTFIIHE